MRLDPLLERAGEALAPVGFGKSLVPWNFGCGRRGEHHSSAAGAKGLALWIIE